LFRSLQIAHDDIQSLSCGARREGKRSARLPSREAAGPWVKPSKRLLGNKTYDSAELRQELDERATKPVTSNRSNGKQPISFGEHLYKLRSRIESAFNRLKDRI